VKHQLLEPLFDRAWRSESEPSEDRPPYAIATPTADDAPVLRETLQSLQRSWRGLAIWFCICFGLTLVYVLNATPEFSAYSQVVLEPRQPGTTTDSAAVSAAQALDSAQADSQVQVIQSERNLRYVFSALGLANDPDFANSGSSLIGWILPHLPHIGSSPALAPEQAAQRALDQAFNKFASGLSVRRLGQSYAFEITYRTLSPAKAAQLANSIAAAYIRDQVAYNVAAAAAQRGGDYLQNRISDANAELETAATAVKTGVIPNYTFGHADARIVSAAIAPLTKSYPATTMALFLAAGFALASGVGAVLIRGGFDRRIRSKEQVRRSTGLDVLGILPRATGSASLSETTERPHQPFSQFVRALRTLVLTAATGPRYAAVGVVSHGCGEGRTLLAGNLASAIASAGQPVTLLDADLRNPVLTTSLAPTADWGLCELALTRGVDATDLQIPLDAMLSFIPAIGAQRGYDPNLFTGSPETLQAISGLAVTRTVIVDLPPLSISADATALGAALTGVIVIVALNQTTVDELSDLVRTLQDRGVRVIGIVLNEGALIWRSLNLLNRLRRRQTGLA
jgi:Mrp family chromosome partitioning ATPase